MLNLTDTRDPDLLPLVGKRIAQVMTYGDDTYTIVLIFEGGGGITLSATRDETIAAEPVGSL